ncbi:hypothetical protein [Arthrobacter sp. MI7-26]|uniref:hypothetical protein n=1 Tax=Arthrobacter sp. MI7-26 TaxID=2993653 RepID=UPI0022490491|nr:hypothetical protein [Arthrobacter sp. MI7-26]
MARRLQVVVDELADRLARSVAIDDPDLTPLLASRHFNDTDELRLRSLVHRQHTAEVVQHFRDAGIGQLAAPTHIEGREDLGFSSRLCVPLRYRGELVGLLFLVDTAPIESVEMSIIC